MMFQLKKKEKIFMFCFFFHLTGDWEEDKTVTDSDKKKTAKLVKDI